MTGVMLDIGAGSTKFARLFRKFNKEYKLMYLCGEPEWKGVWSGKIYARRIQKVNALYNQFNVPDSSLHFVTLNAYHPLMPPQGIQSELVRTLIPAGGVFISAHPVGYHVELPEEYFFPIVFPDAASESATRASCSFSGRKGLWGRPVSSMTIDRYPLLHYPASQTIMSRIRELQVYDELRNQSSSYCYSRNDKSPTIKIWVRNDREAP